MAFEGKLYRQGNSIKQHNNPNPIKILFIEQFGFNHFLNDEIFQAIDIFAATGINGFRVFGFWPYGRGTETEPYVREGNRYNLDRFNDAYFSYLQRWVEYAYEKAIVVRYELFDRCGLTTREVVSDHHPYNQLVGRDRQKFSDLRNTKLVAIQKRYLDKVVEIVKPYPNVIFGIMNEFKSHEDWHYEIARHVKTLAPEHLISGSEEDSPAARDSRCDMWWVHTGTYDFNTGQSHIAKDVAALRQRTGQNKVLGFSTDGFGSRGMARETPNDMRRLAEDANHAGIQLLSFLDQHAYDDSNQGTLPGKASRLNVPTYQALVNTFRPSPLGTVKPLKPLPEGVLSATAARNASWSHSKSFLDHNGRAVRANTQNGFLFFGNYQADYPEQMLTAVFSLYIDNNTYDDAYIAILDVVKNRSQVVASRLLRRTEFPTALKHIKMTLNFSADDPTAQYETRVLYLGFAYLAVDGVYVIDPYRISPDVLPERVSSQTSTSPIPEPVIPDPTPGYCKGNEIICLGHFDSSIVEQNQGRSHGGQYDQGMFVPSNRGGIELQCQLDLNRHFIIEIELEGNIANAHLPEMEGGKVSLFDIKEKNGSYALSFQRMYKGYRGTGIFRIMHGLGGDDIARVITISQLSGGYSMANWGNEPHTLKVEVDGPKCRLMIDQYISRWGSSRQAINGNRQVVLMLGNRVERHSKQQAITKFKRFKVSYV